MNGGLPAEAVLDRPLRGLPLSGSVTIPSFPESLAYDERGVHQKEEAPASQWHLQRRSHPSAPESSAMRTPNQRQMDLPYGLVSGNRNCYVVSSDYDAIL